MRYLIKNGQIIDGTGRAGYEGDVLINEGRIEALGNLKETGDFQVIDAEDLVVCPGFVDLNTHSDTSWTLFEYPGQESFLTQGVTTIIGGTCGSSLAPLMNEQAIDSIQKYVDQTKTQVKWAGMAEFLNFIQTMGLKVNFASLVGHTTLRRALIGDEMRPLKEEELKVVLNILDIALTQGAPGVSLGLVYSHARFADERELLAIAKMVRKHDKLLAVHLRDEGAGIVKAVTEILKIQAETGVNLEISHLKVICSKNWPLQAQVLSLIEEAAQTEAGRGRINFDVYPYTQVGSVLYTLLPRWANKGGKKKLMARIKDSKTRKKLLTQMREKDFDYSSIWIAFSDIDLPLKNKQIGALAENQGRSPEEVVLDLILASDDRLTTVIELMSSKNVEKLVGHELSILSSNGIGYAKEYFKTGNLVHPRCFGAFPCFLKKYVFKNNTLTLERAIEKITGLPAAKAGIDHLVGVLEKKRRADIVIFDPKRIKDMATVAQPFNYWVFSLFSDCEKNKSKPGFGAFRFATSHAFFSLFLAGPL
jgi:N-acyl-D-amino-acid deacylase